MVARVLLQVAAPVPRHAREAARRADEERRVARPQRGVEPVAGESGFRHDVHDAVARVANAADALARDELAVLADADAGRLRVALADQVLERERAGGRAELRMVRIPFRRQVAQVERAGMLRLAEVDRHDPGREVERQRDVRQAGVDEAVVARRRHLSALA